MSRRFTSIKILSIIIMVSIFTFATAGVSIYQYFVGDVAHPSLAQPIQSPTAVATIADADSPELADTVLLQELSDALERPAFVALNYHHIDAEITDNPITISPELFQRHMRTLRRSNYQPINYQQLTKFLQIAERARSIYADRKTLPSNELLSIEERQMITADIQFLNSLPVRGYHITFDDGYESFYRHAYPMLQEQKIPATFFVIVRSSQKALETAPSWIHYPHVTWEQLQTIQRQSLFVVQSHTYSLHSYETTDTTQTIPSLSGRIYRDDLGRTETQEEFLDRIYQDMLLSKSYLENRLRPHIANGLSYPYGVYNEAVIEMAKKADIAYLFTNQPGVITYETSPLEIPRLNAGIPELDGNKLRSLLDSYLAF